jgi:hypothetical protein
MAEVEPIWLLPRDRTAVRVAKDGVAIRVKSGSWRRFARGGAGFAGLGPENQLIQVKEDNNEKSYQRNSKQKSIPAGLQKRFSHSVPSLSGSAEITGCQAIKG